MSLLESLRRQIRRYGRRIFRPMTVDEAAEKKEFFAVSYFLSTLVLFCFVNYMAFSYDDPASKMDTEKRIKYLMEKRGMDKESVTVYSFKNFSKVDEFVVTRDEPTTES